MDDDILPAGMEDASHDAVPADMIPGVAQAILEAEGDEEDGIDPVDPVSDEDEGYDDDDDEPEPGDG